MFDPVTMSLEVKLFLFSDLYLISINPKVVKMRSLSQKFHFLFLRYHNKGLVRNAAYFLYFIHLFLPDAPESFNQEGYPYFLQDKGMKQRI
ncbi:hypothetical protein Taro_046597 [Colocasia esculenta]|uniref:Uncharacterized protein n=1 Tax=Colocasia esculenta TaxID=4460 RepID=A0A843WQE1_COLES|nr:hypothetical protein [Colocasia esculenta]